MPDDKHIYQPGAGSGGNPAGLNSNATPKVWNDPMRPLKIVWIDIDHIKAGPRRLRKALQKQVEDIKCSMERFGNRIPILVDGNHHVIDGHARLAAARLLGAAEMPCIVVGDLPEAEIRRLALSLNKLQETGAWDDEVLRLEISEIIEISNDYEIPGFEVAELDLMLQDISIDASDPDPLDDLDGFVTEGASHVTCQGDVWIAGDHRIACGRAQDLAHFCNSDRMGTAAMVITDPPFNLRVSGHVSTVAGRHAEFAEASGEMSSKEFTSFLVDTLRPAIEKLPSGGVAYICMDWRHQAEILAAIGELDLEQINLVVWAKSAPGMGTLYRSQHELVFVVRKPGAAHRNNVQLGRFGRNRTNLWTYPGATSGNTEEDDFSVHPTVKPVAMIRDAILDVTAPGELVIDCFLGSGTTLIAAETSRRRCLGVEIDPGYVDLALRRWMALTGEQTHLAITGESFEDVALRRAIKLLPAPNTEKADV